MGPVTEVPSAGERFNRLALEVFRYQLEANAVYGAFVRGRGIDPSEVHDWSEIPAVPTRAFKEIPLGYGGSRPVEAIFRTSGTSLGQGPRGVHQVRDLSLYRDSLFGAANRFVAPAFRDTMKNRDHKNNIRLLFITPSPTQLADSSLIFMFGEWMRVWDDGAGAFLADSGWRVRGDALKRAVEACTGRGTPVLLGGTAFSFAHLLDQIDESEIPLPPGSVIVETGGFKGRTQAVPRAELYAGLSRTFGLPLARIVNEYGMTELLSQFYEPVLLEGGPADPEERRHIGPPWVRTSVRDPISLAPARDGEVGILCHVDLANLDSVSAVLTEDLGYAVEDGFRIVGRAELAEARGCSLLAEQLVAAARPPIPT